jgi:predicted dehydrogenase
MISESSRDAIHVGLIGYGYSGKTFHGPLVSAEHGLRLATVVSSKPDAVHADYPHVDVCADPMVAIASNDIDLIVIASPNDTHYRLARAALLAGKHVVVDKPFVLCVDHARELIQLARSKKCLLAAFHNRRWDSDFLSVRKCIEENMIGDVFHFESHFDRFRPHVRQRWRELKGIGSGVWWDLGPHLVDQALQLFGLPDRVQANLARQREGATTDDWAHVVMDFGERRIILHAGMLVAGGGARFLIHGTLGSLVKRAGDPQEAQLLRGMKPHDAGWGIDPDEPYLYEAGGSVRRLATVPGDQSRFYAGINGVLRGNAGNPVPAEQALAVTAVLEAAATAARTSTSVELDLNAEEMAVWM